MTTLRLDRDKQWLVEVRCVPSPNCDERPAGAVIDLVVIHGISLPPGRYGGPHIDQLFTNSLETGAHPYFSGISTLRVSSHLLIDRKGLITQYVPFDRRAWHAGESAFQGRQACNDYSIGVELEGSDEEAYEQCQYEAAVDVTKLLIANWPQITEQRIVAHSAISPGRKTDPGPAFDWNYFFSLMEKR
ncbi:MAG: 1,6-anhydro-N-acetylmuramyl-L-alanine amidase AmpD [Gammaproteobacteria bacterium]